MKRIINTKVILYKIASFLCAIGLVLSNCVPVFAQPSDSMLDFFNENNIPYWNPSGTDSCTIGVGSYDGIISAGLSTTQAAFIDQYHDIAQQLSVEYGIPWETVMAQGILESAAGTSSFAVNRNNFFGIGAFDSNPNNAFSYATPEEGWRGYYENIRKTSTYRNHGVFREPNITDPYAYTEAIKAAGYATDPNYVTKVHQLIAAIENRSQEKGWLSSAELAVRYPAMLTNAAQYAASAGEAPAGSVSYGGGACITSGGNGDINQTALELSWPDRSHNVRDPNEAYKAALSSLGISSTYANNPDWSIAIGSSCDVFVSTVMQYSGVDPNYPLFLRGQITYLPNNPDYQYIGRSDQNPDYQPGDIRVNRAHTEIVVLLEDGQTLGIASASHQDRTADHAGRMYVYHETAGAYDIYRHK